METADISSISSDMLDGVEADSFWCMSRLLDGIQDNYTAAQPGIQRKVLQLEELVTKLDGMGPFMYIFLYYMCIFYFRFFNSSLY